MIALSKLGEPAILSANSAAWTQVVINKLANGEVLTNAEKTRYSHPDIKARLVEETHGKCAYCESKIRHVAPGDIEHVAPKSVAPAAWFEWTNLTLACTECNRRKSDTVGPFIDPYVVLPEDHVEFHGSIVWARGASDQGVFTEKELELNRAELIERRTERLKGLLRQLDLIQVSTNGAVQDALRKDFQRELTSDREFAAMARALADTFHAVGIL